MKKNTTIYGVSILLALAALTMANTGGTPGGYTGSSTDGGATCASGGGCHGTVTSTKMTQEMITSNIPITGYEPGKEYIITLTSSNSGVSKWGFEMMIEDSTGVGVGTFSNSTDVNTKSSGIRATHKSSSTSGIDGRSWEITWTAPGVGSGDLEIYAAVLSANGNNNNKGDNVLIDTLTITEGEVNSISRLAESTINIYPNPTSDLLSISGLVGEVDQVIVLNQSGQEVINTDLTSNVNISSLESGIYYVKVISGSESITKPFVKR